MANNPRSLSLRLKLALKIHRRLVNAQVKEHPLRQLFWECTLRCNLHCRHCGSDCKKTSGQPDMPAKDFMAVLDNIKEYEDPHQVFVVITGGEPLMRDDLEECGKQIYQKGFPWGIVSNGLFLTANRLNGLLNAGLHSITISLDGFKEEHNWMRCHPQSFDRAVEAIKLITAVDGLAYDVVTCVNQSNFERLEEFKQFLIEMGVKAWRVFTVFPVGRAAQDDQMQLSDSQFTALMEFVKSTRREGKIKMSYGCEGFLGNYEGSVRDGFFKCHAGVTVGSVLIDGSISACPSIRADYHQGNIYTDDFMQTWNRKFVPYRDREWMRKDECADCKHFADCRGNGMHLRDADGNLMVCHLKRLVPLI